MIRSIQSKRRERCLRFRCLQRSHGLERISKFMYKVMTRRAADALSMSPSSGLALFDADRFSEPLVVRHWQAGDRFFPHGMKGKSKKLQDFFTDRKIARRARETVPLLVAPEGILWVVGMRQDERFVVRDETTRCLVVSVSQPGVREGVREHGTDLRSTDRDTGRNARQDS